MNKKFVRKTFIIFYDTSSSISWHLRYVAITSSADQNGISAF